jgi:hypothetical protein
MNGSGPDRAPGRIIFLTHADTDVLAIASIVFFALAARGPKVETAPAVAVAH